ncbi:non-ribosomal peptide synthetase [Stachybotrys elegans]|uniref:Non-ribosomal peptide synthetase n=1 Tax=Stachybotrys elegans TaxID=80388 RepID=A0A8K0WTZ2_9HYPO|nr:non-ribosomal peptide synthetase [Stachybotrys elegans]
MPHTQNSPPTTGTQIFGHGESIQLPFTTLTGAFYHQVSQRPDALAVRDLSGSAPREWTYQQLAARVQALALRLRKSGVKPHDRVPLIVKRGMDMVVGIWAILSCGGQYVPLDGSVVPDSTICHVAQQSGVGIVVCVSATEKRVRSLCPESLAIVVNDEAIADEEEAAGEWLDLAEPSQGCYVIYTSGTTGKPKGVDVSHRNVANLVCLYPGNLGIRPRDRVGQVLNISFDMAAWEVFACLCNGGTLVLRGSDWEQTLREIDVLICTPTILSRYHPREYPNIKVAATAGEPTSQCLADLWARHATYWNCCGPTETTIVNTMQQHVAGDTINIGKPTPNNQVYILNSEGQHVPVGQAGIMWAGGQGVSRGYVGLESKTREVYVPDPFAKDGSCMYKTGDLGQWRSDGCIEILGRVDDQVKVKGFRIELDGISSTLASAPGITRAVALLIDGEIHGFTSPAGQDVYAILEHTRARQPYYAVPSHIHQVQQFPLTNNGKIDKKALAAIAAAPPSIVEKCHSSQSDSNSDASTIAEVQSLSSYTSSTLTAVSLQKDLTADIDEKHLPQPLRGLRHRIFIVYRVLFSLVGLCNIAAIIAVLVTNAGLDWLATLTAANLAAAVLVRQDMVINLLYTIFCSVPKSSPIWIRKRAAKIYHLGGVHSGAGVCATAWLLASTVTDTVAYTTRASGSASLATLVISWMLCSLCFLLVGFAWPAFRKSYHNLFERLHRFLGWTALLLFWVKTCLSVRDETPAGDDLGLALVKSPSFWLLGLSTCSIASSWLFLRKVDVDAEPLSDHAVRLHFNYTVPVNGTFTRLSRRPLLEWHSFATIPEPEGSSHTQKPGYSLVVSNAGDWTKDCIRNPGTKIWVRGLPTCGVMRIATLFNRVVVIATGSGIGPLLGHISQPTCPTQLIWSTSQPEKTFGKDILKTIRDNIPHAVIHDTKTHGRPDLVRMGFNLVRDFGAEAVIVIANEKITKKIVYGLETRGIPAYGAIWDS